MEKRILPNQFTAETLSRVAGYDGQPIGNLALLRTPLNVDFGLRRREEQERLAAIPSKEISDMSEQEIQDLMVSLQDTTSVERKLAEQDARLLEFVEPTFLVRDAIYDTELFNAVGSKIPGTDYHMPLIDADGGAMAYNDRYNDRAGSRTRVVIHAQNTNGSFSLTNELPELLGDYGIKLRVSDSFKSEIGWGVSSATKHVGAIAMIADIENPFHVAYSSTRSPFQHAHVYMNVEMSDTDHSIFLDSLKQLGIISTRWADLSEKYGMGIVRTPWALKDPEDMPS